MHHVFVLDDDPVVVRRVDLVLVGRDPQVLMGFTHVFCCGINRKEKKKWTGVDGFFFV